VATSSPQQTDSPPSPSLLPGGKRLVFLIAYLLGVAIFIEGAARGILAVDSLSRNAALRSSAGWRLWWLERHQPGVPIFYGFDEFHPTRGWASRERVRDADTFGPGTVNTNSAGLRGEREVALEKDPNRPRIAVVGDSFTFGDEVRDEDAYPHVLNELLPEAEVVNFGVHGYGHDQMLLLLREQALAYEPDVVVLGFVRDDMERNMLAFRDFAKPHFVLAGDRLSLRNVPVPTPEEVARRYRWRPRLLDLASILRDNYLWKVGLYERRMEALTTALLDEMVEEAVATGSIFVFVYLPHSEELIDPELETPGYEFFDNYCAERAAFCLDLLPRFREEIEAGIEIRAPGHWHQTGHRLVAESVGEFIRDRELLNL
jgi:hypothetical protein